MVGDTAGRRCAVCGEEPSLGLEAEAPSAIKSTPKDPLLRVKMADVEKPAVRKREVRRRKTSNFAMKLIIVWLAVLALLGAAGHWLWKAKPRDEAPEQTVSENASKGTLADEDTAKLVKAYPKCREMMGGFLMAGTPEERNQFVRTPVDTVARMARFYQMNPMSNIDPQSVRGAGGGVVALKNHQAIETRWQTTDGREFDAVFFDEKGEWRLDWEDYAQYSDHPWALFLSGDGPDEAEFRLFARERLPEQRSEMSQLRIVLHAPRFGFPGEAGEASPEFRIDQESPQGVLIKAALAERTAGKRIFGSSLPNHDPDGMIRLRVKIRRSDGALGREFTIEQVVACHWLSIPETGVGAQQ
jgi:hypothetical protein